MELIRIRSLGAGAQTQTSPGEPAFEAGVLGVAMSPKSIDGADHTVVQVMLDDDRPGFDHSMLDAPMLAEIRTPAGDIVTRELLDHDEFRRRLRAERDNGGGDLRGVLLLTAGGLPPAYLRLAYFAIPVGDTDGCDLVITVHERDALLEAVDAAGEHGALSEREHQNLRTTIEQRHPA